MGGSTGGALPEPRDDFTAALAAGLEEQASNVALHGADADAEAGGDGPRGGALGEQVKDLPFPGRQLPLRGERVDVTFRWAL